MTRTQATHGLALEGLFSFLTTLAFLAVTADAQSPSSPGFPSGSSGRPDQRVNIPRPNIPTSPSSRFRSPFSRTRTQMPGTPSAPRMPDTTVRIPTTPGQRIPTTPGQRIPTHNYKPPELRIPRSTYQPPTQRMQMIKTCTKCNKTVPDSSRAGQRCPHCGIRWGYDTTSSGSKRFSGISFKPSYNRMSSSSNSTISSIGIVSGVAVVLVVLTALTGGIIVARRQRSRQTRTHGASTQPFPSGNNQTYGTNQTWQQYGQDFGANQNHGPNQAGPSQTPPPDPHGQDGWGKFR